MNEKIKQLISGFADIAPNKHATKQIHEDVFGNNRDKDTNFELCIACVYASKNSVLSRFKVKARQAIYYFARQSIEQTFFVLNELDSEWRCGDLILWANKQVGTKLLLSKFFETQDKFLQKLLIKFSDTISDFVQSNYTMFSQKQLDMLNELFAQQNLSSQPKVYNFGFEYKDNTIVCNTTKIVYGIDNNFVLTAPKWLGSPEFEPRDYDGVCQRFCKKFEQKIASYCKDMICGTQIPFDQFELNIKQAFFGLLAESLVFAKVKDSQIVDIFVVHQGQICGIDNNPIISKEFEGCTVSILHPIQLPKKHENLKYIQMPQPFEQLSRATFAPVALDKSTNSVQRHNGTRITEDQLKSNLKGVGTLKRLNKCVYVQIAKYYVCYNLISREDDGAMTLGTIEFFEVEKTVKFGNSPEFGISQVVSPSQVDTKVFSEALRAAAVA